MFDYHINKITVIICTVYSIAHHWTGKMAAVERMTVTENVLKLNKLFRVDATWDFIFVADIER